MAEQPAESLDERLRRQLREKLQKQQPKPGDQRGRGVPSRAEEIERLKGAPAVSPEFKKTREDLRERQKEEYRQHVKETGGRGGHVSPEELTKRKAAKVNELIDLAKSWIQDV